MKALVTGGGRGIGAATALMLARSGFDLVLVSRTMAELEATRNRIISQNSAQNIKLVSMDVADEAQVQRLFEEEGAFDFVVNNAGYIKVAPVENLSTSDWQKILDINLSAVFFICREVFKSHRPGASACIVNISSLGGVYGLEKFSGFSAYTTAKAAVIALTECLAVEGKPKNIRVNAIAPGTVNTRMLREALPEVQTTTQPEDIAKEILYFIEDPKGKNMTGIIKELSNA